jgi:hypothetical protein
LHGREYLKVPLQIRPVVEDQFLEPGFDLPPWHHEKKPIPIVDVCPQHVIPMRSFSVSKGHRQLIDEAPYHQRIARETRQRLTSNQNRLAGPTAGIIFLPGIYPASLTGTAQSRRRAPHLLFVGREIRLFRKIH